MRYHTINIWLERLIKEYNTFIPVNSVKAYVPANWEESDKKEDIKHEVFDRAVYKLLIMSRDRSATYENIKFSIRVIETIELPDDNFKKGIRVDDKSYESWVPKMEEYCKNLYIESNNNTEF